MSRSVDYLTGATAVAYIDAGELEDSLDWDLFQEGIADNLKSLFPSLYDCSAWDGNEVQIFLENSLVDIGISEYCGLVSVSMRPKEGQSSWSHQDISGLATAWADRARDTFLSIGNLTKVATFSNGEAIFNRKNKDGK